MYKHILLPTDGSEACEQAVRNGIAFAREIGARVTGLHVIVESRVAAGLGKSTRKIEDEVAAAEQYLGVISAEAKKAGVPCECFHVTGETAFEEIVRTAEKRGCDLIFMASHRRRGLAGMLIGSQSLHVLTHSKVPVLIHR
jgi:nucleotide-binding universal stress UspA family protein